VGAEVKNEHFSEAERALFARRLRTGLAALDTMLRRPGFGLGERSIGVELEMFLVDERGRAKPVGQELARLANDACITPEIGRFDIEYSTPPLMLAGHPFSELRARMQHADAKVRECAAKLDARAVPVSILPTLQRDDFGAHTITDLPRYRALANNMHLSRRAPFQICISGDDPLRVSADDVAMESANTGFQIHLKVSPAEFASFFNAAQMLTGPVLAAAGNSPTFLGHRLWHETRIALFKQAGDDRPADARAGFRLPARVGFGTGWVREGAAEVFAESVALHELLLAECSHEDPELALRAGRVPKLSELRLHHGTVWRWNRPVYDPTAGGSLRIELRALPSGPTIEDMIANAAVLIGAVIALAPRVRDMLPAFPFALAERNFYRAAQHGLDAEMAWPPDKHCAAPAARSARQLLLETVLPLAREGLRSAGVAQAEAEAALAVFEQRVQVRQTGAVWQRAIFEALVERGVPRESALAGLLEHYLANVETGRPVGVWPAELDANVLPQEAAWIRDALLEPGGPDGTRVRDV